MYVAVHIYIYISLFSLSLSFAAKRLLFYICIVHKAEAAGQQGAGCRQ